MHILANGLIWFLTLAKYKKIEIPVLSLVIWDGTRAFAFILGWCFFLFGPSLAYLWTYTDRAFSVPYIALLVNVNAYVPNIEVYRTYVNQSLFPCVFVHQQRLTA